MAQVARGRQGHHDGVMGSAMAGVWLAALLSASTALPSVAAEPTAPQQVPPVQVPLPQQRRPRLGVYLESDAAGVWAVASGDVAAERPADAGSVSVISAAVQQKGQ